MFIMYYYYPTHYCLFGLGGLFPSYSGGTMLIFVLLCRALMGMLVSHHRKADGKAYMHPLQ